MQIKNRLNSAIDMLSSLRIVLTVCESTPIFDVVLIVAVGVAAGGAWRSPSPAFRHPALVLAEQLIGGIVSPLCITPASYQAPRALRSRAGFGRCT